MDQLVHQAGRHRRQADDANDTETCGGGGGPNTSEPGEGDFDSIELIGDLQTLSDADLSPVGRSVKNIILGQDCPESDITWDSEVPALGTAACQKDVCCIWQYIADDMMSVFRGRSGRCTGLARAAVRLGFHVSTIALFILFHIYTRSANKVLSSQSHCLYSCFQDAGGFSKATGPGGGADGSIILAPSEMQRSENNGLQDIVAHMQSWYTKWTADPSYYHYQYPTTTTTTSNEANERITMADLIQFGAHLAVVACPLGPRIRTFLGRADNASAAPEGLLPPVDGSAAFLIDLFRNKTIAPHGLAALVGAHTTSQQFFVDEARAGDPQDSTPGIWDVLFYQQTTLNAVTTTTQQVPPRVFMFDSDVALARDSSTGPEMALFAANGGQVDWNEVCQCLSSDDRDMPLNPLPDLPKKSRQCRCVESDELTNACNRTMLGSTSD